MAWQAPNHVGLRTLRSLGGGSPSFPPVAGPGVRRHRVHERGGSKGRVESASAWPCSRPQPA